MDSTCDLIIDSLKEEPIGETDHFIWFITDIAIVALFKREENFETYNSFLFCYARYSIDTQNIWATLV